MQWFSVENGKTLPLGGTQMLCAEGWSYMVPATQVTYCMPAPKSVKLTLEPVELGTNCPYNTFINPADLT
jgi:hypothetical protein